MTQRIRKMILLLTVALLAAALLSACSGSSKKDGPQENAADERRQTEVASYTKKEYLYRGDYRVLIKEEECDLDQKGRVIRRKQLSYDSGMTYPPDDSDEPYMGTEERCFFDELDRMYYEIVSGWYRDVESTEAYTYVYDGDSQRVLYSRRESDDGTFSAEENKYDSMYNVIFRRKWSEDNDIPEILVDSYVDQDITVVRFYDDDGGVSMIEERSFDRGTNRGISRMFDPNGVLRSQSTTAYGMDGTILEFSYDTAGDINGVFNVRNRTVYDGMGRVISEEKIVNGVVVSYNVYFWDVSDYPVANREVNLRRHYKQYDDEMLEDEEEYFIVLNHPVNEPDEDYHFTILKNTLKYVWANERAEHPNEKDMMETVVEAEFDNAGHIIRQTYRGYSENEIREYDEYDHRTREYRVKEDGTEKPWKEYEYTYFPKYFTE